MDTYDVAIIPGDGIGPAVTEAALSVLDHLGETHGFALERTTYDWGTERYLETGSMMPDDGLEKLESTDAIFLGAVGHPEVPDHVTLNGLLLPIRKGFDQYVCKRPNVLYEGIDSPLRGYSNGDIDLVVYRENTEGEYANIGGREHRGFDHEVAVQSSVFTRSGTERIVRRAFEAADRRDGQLTSITKSNAQAHSMVFWDDVVDEVSEEFSDVSVDRLLVDRASMDLVRRPESFDVLVASNLFGDIITDIAGIVTGSLGLAPSGNINPDGAYPSMYEPVHGSAYDIVGENCANPLASVLTGAMLLDDLVGGTVGETLREGVESLLADPNAPKTPDLGGSASTDAVVAALIDRL